MKAIHFQVIYLWNMVVFIHHDYVKKHARLPKGKVVLGFILQLYSQHVRIIIKLDYLVKSNEITNV
jgi:hypothetical protein